MPYDPDDLHDRTTASEPAGEPRYTLEEAARILARRECDTNGHDLEQNVLRRAEGTVVRILIVCNRCSAVFQEVTDA